MKRLVPFFTLLGAIALVLAACAKATPEPATFTIEMTEYAFNPSQIEVQAGQEVTLNLVNKGQLEHELMIGRDTMMMDNRPSGYQVDFFENAGVEPMVMTEAEMHMEEEGHQGFMVGLPNPGDQATLTFTVTPDMAGEWEIGCFEQDGVHYDAGMKGTLIVNR
jgi:uncharacterized cupredoxin-like copper-binding protein